jgi:predicted DNA-binding transcriptional regulator AlpA
MSDRRLMTAQEVEATVRLSQGTIKRKWAEGTFPRPIMVSRRWLFRADEVQAWIADSWARAPSVEKALAAIILQLASDYIEINSGNWSAGACYSLLSEAVWDAATAAANLESKP